MGRCSGRGMAMACLMILMSCMVAPTLQFTVFTVGGGVGWVPGVDYNAWAKDKPFKVGDWLVFDYPSGLTVDEVFENDYNTCSTGHPISSDNSGSTPIPLLTAGLHYFMCGVADYCAKGMKLAVNVMAKSTPLPSHATNASSSSPPASD
ncbi:hypothetical protein DITRI_Ditri03aG0167400 [Diplodiscus trichospermus]